MQGAAGILYLHHRKPPIVHRDIKSDNFLIDSNYNVKVCDFGLARFRKVMYADVCSHMLTYADVCRFRKVRVILFLVCGERNTDRHVYKLALSLALVPEAPTAATPELLFCVCTPYLC